MKTTLYRSIFNKHSVRSLAALLVVAMFGFSNLAVFAHPKPQPTSAPAQETQDEPKIPNDQLDSLVAPIALYPDPLLSQMLVASTYPLELIQLQQWLAKDGQYLNEKAVAEAVQKQDWDPSIQAMALLPTVVKQLAENIKWTSDLGNAFLAQQSDVMDAVQRMRTKAKDGGKLQSSEQLKVETQQVENKTVVVIEQANPEVVYVPSYNPSVVWGAMPYPYPYMYYPPYGYYGGAYIGYGAGIAIGVAWGGGWGWGSGWGNNDITINRNNNFNRNTSINGGNRVNNIQGGNKWQHNPQHRGGAPYSNRATTNRFAGAPAGKNFGGSRPQAGTLDRSSFGIGNRDLSSVGGSRGNFGGDRIGSNRDLSSVGGSRGNFGGDRIGSRDISRGAGARNTGSWGGGSFGGGAARASSSRGASSMGGGSWGGRGGGGGGGGMRGGGGGMRGGGRRR